MIQYWILQTSNGPKLFNADVFEEMLRDINDSDSQPDSDWAMDRTISEAMDSLEDNKEFEIGMCGTSYTCTPLSVRINVYGNINITQ